MTKVIEVETSDTVDDVKRRTHWTSGTGAAQTFILQGDMLLGRRPAAFETKLRRCANWKWRKQRP